MKLERLAVLIAAGPVLPMSGICNASDNRPNIIIVLADDMGYSDIGCYGGEIQTPNIDSLAKEGLRWKQFYNNARSCPSRAALMTGLYPHQSGMGWMAAANMGRPEYQGYLNDRCVTIAEVLKQNGYGTYMVGKWHLCSDWQASGNVIEKWPCARGFDRYYGIPEGAGNYFNAKTVNDTERVCSQKDFYLTDALSDSAATFISRHDYRANPLFLYLAYNAPHWPLHAPEEVIEKYVETYKVGWDKIREARFRRQKDIGLFGENAVLSPRDSAVPAWNTLDRKTQDEFAVRMAIYAAQIDIMDKGIGKVIKALKDAGQFDNTIIMFMSDNGACAEFISRGKSKALTGASDTYESYRVNWANVSSTPYREYKHFTHEGGIASPLVVSWPDGIASEKNGDIVDEYGYFADIMATCVDVSKSVYPTIFNGHEIIPMEGVSLVPVFSGNRTGRGMTFWEHEANIAVRDGDWKLVLKTEERKTPDFSKVELYNMSSDPTEMCNLASSYPEKVAFMLSAWNDWADRVHALPLDTRAYGERADASRRLINGEFDDNYGGWVRKCTEPSDVDFEIDTAFSISGRKAAVINVRRTGKRDSDAFLKWNFPSGSNGSVSVQFKCRSGSRNYLAFRIENAANPAEKYCDEDVFLKRGDRLLLFENISIPENSRLQLVFYVGKSVPGNIMIDDIELIFND